jgi:hypothetical protein
MRVAGVNVKTIFHQLPRIVVHVASRYTGPAGVDRLVFEGSYIHRSTEQDFTMNLYSNTIINIV